MFITSKWHLEQDQIYRLKKRGTNCKPGVLETEIAIKHQNLQWKHQINIDSI